MRQHAVRRWRDAMLHDLDSVVADPLSRAGTRAAVHAALSTWTDAAIQHLTDLPGTPYRRAAIVAPRTVCTAPLEWCVGWALSGTPVVWKHPMAQPGLAPWAARHASSVGLSLTATADRGAIEDADVVVVMGSDDTVEALVDAHRVHATVLGFGHRFSAGWLPRRADFDAPALARDLLLHDGRGCMTPSLLFTDDVDHVLADLLPALTQVAERWPPGTLAPVDHAHRRARRDLAEMVGAVHHAGDVDVVVLTHDLASPSALPRSVTIVPVSDAADVHRWLTPRQHQLSVLTVPPSASAPLTPPAGRVAPPGDAQRPALLREHDGVPMLRAWRRVA